MVGTGAARPRALGSHAPGGGGPPTGIDTRFVEASSRTNPPGYLPRKCKEMSNHDTIPVRKEMIEPTYSSSALSLGLLFFSPSI